ncbi:DUF5616 domain-containing protein [Clostridium perfringens]
MYKRVFIKIYFDKGHFYSRVWNINTEVNLVNNAEVILENLDRVVSTDAVIIDKCKSYFNLASEIIRDYIKDANIVDLED